MGTTQFFFSSRRRHTRWNCDWSSDVCSSDLKVPSERCPTCQGSGDVRVQKRLMITVEPGTEDGTRVRLTGQGTLRLEERRVGKGSAGRPYAHRSSSP